MNYFIGRKNTVSVLRYIDFCFSEIQEFQNLWRHHRHCCIMNSFAYFVSPKYYQNEIWSNTSISYNKYFWHVFGSMLETETSSRPMYDFNEMTIKIYKFLVVNIYHFLSSLIHPFKKMKHWKLNTIGYWVIGAGC